MLSRDRIIPDRRNDGKPWTFTPPLVEPLLNATRSRMWGRPRT